MRATRADDPFLDLASSYVRDVRLLRRGPIDDDVVFTPWSRAARV
jgi:hypothetical protein